ncbi:hypothetical protein Hamer_G020088 [Homarus americanus]|uniref:Uncharacterized protein n=1 Tax=Homarus americanus TaxID=6706 RepID=A0A8J5MJS4_HOMAM|nr:hypothetical protein Hamer_G020088 [Homarus americanus]
MRVVAGSKRRAVKELVFMEGKGHYLRWILESTWGEHSGADDAPPYDTILPQRRNPRSYPMILS